MAEPTIEAIMPPLVDGAMYDMIVPQSWAWGEGKLGNGTKVHVLEIRSAQSCQRLVMLDENLRELIDQAQERVSGLKVARLETIKGP